MPPRRGGRQPQHRVYQPGKRHMELMPTISRSSGLDRDGDSLKDHKVQEEYRAFIQEKVDAYFEKDFGSNEKQKTEVAQNLLILYRKLREGIQASQRTDVFAVEVYEASLHLSIVFQTPVQTTSTLSHLLPYLYQRTSSTPSSPSEPYGAQRSTVLALLHDLVSGHPSQSRYHERLHALPRAFIPKGSATYQWLSGLTRCLRRRDYARLDALTQSGAFDNIISHETPPPSEVALRKHEERDLYRQALLTLVHNIRAKAREGIWLVIRNAYRELSCPPNADSDIPSSTSEWLARTLVLCPIIAGAHDAGPNSPTKLVDRWLNDKAESGEVRCKEGAEGQWIVCKVATKV